MQISQKYLHDRLALLLLGINGFLSAVGILLIVLKVSSSQGSSYITAYRANVGVSRYTSGSLVDFLSFVVFILITFGLTVALSAKIYGRHRSYALTVLALGILLSVLTIIVSNALLVLG